MSTFAMGKQLEEGYKNRLFEMGFLLNYDQAKEKQELVAFRKQMEVSLSMIFLEKKSGNRIASRSCSKYYRIETLSIY